MNEQKILNNFSIASEQYAAIGVDVERALKTLQEISISLHCWQADDVGGFENYGDGLSGGIQVTGNYPGKARTIDELRSDILQAATLIPGAHRLSLHAIYGDFQGQKVDRDAIAPEHFQGWIDWGKANNIKLDFNSTSFSHHKSGNLSLSNPDEGIRNFWIEHTQRCRMIADEMGRQQNDKCTMNLWVHDGSKEVPASRLLYRTILKDSLDKIFATKYDHMRDSVESKLFGIGLESYTVGSFDFYLAYAIKNNMTITLDTGHFHLTESVADKISSLLLFAPEIMLHVSRPVRWDSDHVVIINDELTDLCREIIRCDALNRMHIGLDFFDASINRVGAYVVGTRATQKALLMALLEPTENLMHFEKNDMLFERLAMQEECKNLPWGAIYDYFCLINEVPVGLEYLEHVKNYEKTVTNKR